MAGFLLHFVAYSFTCEQRAVAEWEALAVIAVVC